jgi:hypothetical protein
MPGQFNFAVTLMNVLLVLSQTEFSQSMIHSGVMQHLWMQLLPPPVPVEATEQINSSKVSVVSADQLRLKSRMICQKCNIGNRLPTTSHLLH